MFKRILYPVDFSSLTQRCLDFIKQLKCSGVGEVVLVHVVDTRYASSVSWAFPENFMEDEAGLKERLMEKINPIKDELEKEGYKVRVRIEKGNPFVEILRVEEEEDVSFVVIGSHGVTHLGKFLLGSVSDAVLRNSKKPVLLVRE
jgi:nucleotide-binding universal stress UspA family protein